MPATATAVVPYVRAEFAPDDGADEFVDVDLDVGLTPEDEEELVLEVNEPGGQNKKIIQTDRLIIPGERYIRIFLEAEGKTVEAWTERVAQLADGCGWTSNQVQEELKRMLLKWKEQGWIRKDEEGKTKGRTYPINETNLRALRSGFQAILTQPPTRFLRLGKDGYFNKLPIYQELWELCKGKVAEERIAAGTAQLTSSGTLTLTTPAFAFSTSAGGRKELNSLTHTMRPSSASPATSTDTCVLVSCTKLAVGFNSAPASLWHLRCGIGSLPV